MNHDLLLDRLLDHLLGREGRIAVRERLWVDPELDLPASETVPRRCVALALNAALFADLLARVPSGAAYVERQRAAGRRVVFDHGALRTVALSEHAPLPPLDGEAAITRILQPLGYARVGHYPLPRLRMEGYAFAQQDAPETLPQFFVSRLEVGRFSPDFQSRARRVFGSWRDPLTPEARRLLDVLAAEGEAPVHAVQAGLPGLLGCFGRSHEPPTRADYEALKAESAEAAWIATEGQVLNHVTDRVADVAATAEAERRAGQAVKDTIEVSASGSVRQTALRADRVERRFADGCSAWVPGSFFEFISRDRVLAPDGVARLDLRFDSGNAQGIFRMTAPTP